MNITRWALATLPLLLSACAQFGNPFGAKPSEFSPAGLQALQPAQLRSTLGTAQQAQARREQARAQLLAALPQALARPEDPAVLQALAQGLESAAHYNMELERAQPALLAVLPTLDRQPAALQRPLLTAAYSLYPEAARPALRPLLARLASPREFAIAAYALLGSGEAADRALVQAQLQQRLAQTPNEPRLLALVQALQPTPARPPLAELFRARPGHVVVFSLQRPGRQQMGLALVRQADGRFVRRPDGGLFNIAQLALARSGLPGTLTLGNTPQGLFTIQGAGRAASNVWIGATPYLHTKVPLEASVAEFEQRAPGSDEPAWSEARYTALLPAAWRGYAPLREAWLAGRAGRDEMLMHGSTMDPQDYRGQPYFPGTPSAGCLVAMEYWGPDGALLHSDQLALLKAFTGSGQDRGYLLLLELDAAPTPVSLAEVIAAVREAEARP